MIYTNRFQLPESIVRAVIGTNATYTGPKAEATKISVTTLIGPARIHYLKCKHWAKLTEDVMDSVWKILGSAAHAIMEKAEGKQDISEERLEKNIDGLTISGAFDLYDGKTQELHDYKTTSAYSITFSPNGKPEWEKQMNIYAYLLEEAGFPVKGLKIICILRDWSATKASPKNIIEDGGSVKKLYLDGTGPYPASPIHILNIPLWGKDKTEAYIKERVAIFKAAKDLADDALPACTDEEMWAKPGTWAIMKPGGKKAVKVCYSKEEADANLAPGLVIQERPGTRTRCEGYCPVRDYCNIYKAYKGAV